MIILNNNINMHVYILDSNAIDFYNLIHYPVECLHYERTNIIHINS